MEMVRTSRSSEGDCILDAETSPDSDLNSSSSLLYQLRQLAGSRQNIGFTTRSENTSASCAKDIFEGLLKSDGVVKGPMERDFQRCSQLYEFTGTLDIHRAIGTENTEDKTCSSKGACMREVFLHELKLILRIEEVAAARPQQDMHGELAAQNRCTDKTVAGCEAALTERGAKFDAVRPSFACCEAGLDTLRTKFEDNLAH
ncbi:hypothetical protein AciX8_2519 [Granulicella mallensis MP5ACTX8]|uniref:Uncharacterized protein n=1 Tax=Granulicella mallensis (strain ATCC BAA-1857 / DSM 23137 / MP5ACTX8) TaxID=682795 RepID=G8NZ98_GRAMM|nr:hypothetical protein AciX8_2519 [Granulicella mallensis MP5ACTX8]